MLNLLLVTSHLPYPLTSGGNQAQFHIIDFLRKHEVNVSMIFNENRYNSKENLCELKKIWPDIKFYPYRWTKKNNKKEVFFLKLIKKFYRILFSRGYPITFLDTLLFEELMDDFILHVNNVIAKDDISVVQIDFDVYLPLVFALPDEVKKVYVQHEIQFVRRELLLKSKNITCFYQNFIFNKMKCDEISAMNNYNLVITLTEIDKIKLINNGVITLIEDSPACVNTKSEENIFKGSINKLIFVGGCNHYPNLNGLEWFFKTIWDKILNIKPDVTIDIVGNWDEKYKNEFVNKYRNVNFLGFVNDLSSVLKNAIMVVPLKIGSGMRMKLVDAANYGCPFVTTSVGVEGLHFKNNKDCYIEDNENEFAIKVISLIENQELQKTFSQNIKNIFENEYSISILGERRRVLLENL